MNYFTCVEWKNLPHVPHDCITDLDLYADKTCKKFSFWGLSSHMVEVCVYCSLVNSLIFTLFKKVRTSLICFFVLFLPSWWKNRCCRTNGASTSDSADTLPSWPSECRGSLSSWALTSHWLVCRGRMWSPNHGSPFLRRSCSCWSETISWLKGSPTQRTCSLKRRIYP